MVPPVWDQYSRYDSAGIDVVATALELGSVRVRVPQYPPPSVVIGADLDAPLEYQFERIRLLVPLGDSGIAVVENGSAPTIRVFDAEGQHVRTIDRRGQGPGEYQQLGQVAVGAGDTIWVLDRDRRLTYLPLSGGESRSVQLRALPGARLGPSSIGGKYPVILSQRPVRSDPGCQNRWCSRDVEILAVSSDGDLEPLLELEGPEWLSRSFGSTRRMYSGRRDAFEHPSWFAWLDGDSGVLRFWDRSGRLRRMVRFTHPRLPVTAEQRNAYTASLRGDYESSQRAMPSGIEVPSPLDNLFFSDSLPRIETPRRSEFGGWEVALPTQSPIGSEREASYSFHLDDDWRLIEVIQRPSPEPGGEQRGLSVASDSYIWSAAADELGVQRVERMDRAQLGLRGAN